jgi:putative secretion ATPase (PEP-CTERM system associated)
MYAEFYGLNSMPFQLTPDSRFFFGSAEHNKAMAFLNYGISQGEGFVVVTGEVGAGKTTLVDHLLSTLDPTRYIAGRIVTTQLNSYDMLRMVGAAFQIFREGMDKASLVTRIRQLLADLATQHKRALLIVDEAQSLTTEALEELRMLSNLMVNGGSPLQSILLGQPEFRQVLSSPDLEQLRQRVTASCHLGALNEADTRRYIEHRLRRSGWKNDPTFSESALVEIYRYTAGIPRRINTLCSRILLLGFLEEKRHIEGDMVVSVANELAAELGPLQGLGAPAPRPIEAEPMHIPEPLTVPAASEPESELTYVREIRNLRDDLMPRISRIEQKMYQHDKAITRALDIAVKHLPAFKS